MVLLREEKGKHLKQTVASTKCSQREGVLNFGPENLANLFDISFSKMLLPFQMLTLLLMC